MSNEVTKKARDNFDYDPLSEYPGSGGEESRPARSMQGETKLKFVDPDWTADGIPCNDRVLVCYDRVYAAVHWGENAPIEVRVVARGEPIPDLKALNAAIPQKEWRTGLSGKPEPPWQLQRVLEFLDPETAERLSWPSNVTVAGSSRAAEELEGRIRIVRRLRGEDVYPRIQLSHKFMPTQFGGRERPHLPIVGWVRFGEHGGLEAIETNVTPETQLPPACYANHLLGHRNSLCAQSRDRRCMALCRRSNDGGAVHRLRG
jgi:hypothetical protein